MYYIRKWVEAKYLYQSSEKKFLYEGSFTCFGVPREIVTYHGAQFTSKSMKSVVQQYQIKNYKSSPYHS
jgi:hypothetical protein